MTNPYCSVADINALGMVDPDYPDATILAAITTWQTFIERACRQWFYPRTLTFNVDGNDSDTLHFGVPIISITELRINNDTTALDSSLYAVYSTGVYPDNRQNPCIKLISSDDRRDIYTSPDRYGRRLFRKGVKSQYISGSFGYVESDSSTPELIKRALIKLVVEKLTTPVYSSGGGDAPPLLTGIVVEEVTDGHRIKYAQSGGELSKRAPGLSGITNDPEVLGILKMYRAPIGIATPANPSFR